MDAKDGKLIGRMAVDALAKAQEHANDPTLLAVSIFVLVEDGEGNIHTVVQTWPRD